MHQHHKHQQSSDFEFSLEVVFEIGPELDSECPMFSQTNVAAVKSIGQVLGHSEEGAQKFLELEEEISFPIFEGRSEGFEFQLQRSTVPDPVNHSQETGVFLSLKSVLSFHVSESGKFLFNGFEIHLWGLFASSREREALSLVIGKPGDFLVVQIEEEWLPWDLVLSRDDIMKLKTLRI